MTHPTHAKELLTSQLAAVRGELTRVDAKCSTLVSLAGAALAFLVTQAHGPLLVRVLLAAAGVTLAGATVALLAVLRPRLGTTGFRRFAVMDSAEVRALFTVRHPFDPEARGNGGAAQADPVGIECEDLRVLSQIVNRKYLGLRLAVDLVAAAAVLVAAALIIAVTA
jgi:Family of unknown function (DUF5706)